MVSIAIGDENRGLFGQGRQVRRKKRIFRAAYATPWRSGRRTEI